MEHAEIRIGEWLVSPALNQISRPGRVVNLEPRLIDLLVFFSRHPEVVLSRDELIAQIWTRTFVTPHVVTQSISELRKSLKDNQTGSPEYIITVPKRGYKLVAAVSGEVCQPDAGLLCHENPQRQASLRHHRVLLPSAAFRSRGTLLCFLLTLAVCIVLIVLAYNSARTFSRPANMPPEMINPRDIDIRLVPGNSCNQWQSQYVYVSGLSDVISRLFNTYSGWRIRDKSSGENTLAGYPGKTLSIAFINQRHYRAQQCFMSVQLTDHASRTVMLEQRYFITRDNALAIQNDLIRNLSLVLKQQWPVPLATLLRQYTPGNSSVMQQYYRARQLLMKGDIDSLNQASALLSDVIRQQPDFKVAVAEKILADTLHNSEQPFSGSRQLAFIQEVNSLENINDKETRGIYYQIMTINALGEGNVQKADAMIHNGMINEYSWLNFILQGKVYELKGDNQLAADSYITSFNLQPTKQTLYWIENGVFQTPLWKVVPYLEKFSDLR